MDQKGLERYEQQVNSDSWLRAKVDHTVYVQHSVNTPTAM